MSFKEMIYRQNPPLIHWHEVNIANQAHNCVSPDRNYPPKTLGALFGICQLLAISELIQLPTAT